MSLDASRIFGKRSTPPGERDDRGGRGQETERQNVEEELEYIYPIPVPPTRQVPRTELEGDRADTFRLEQNAGGTAALDAQLGFLARSVRVDNYTTRWLYVADLDMYVPPRCFGMISSIVAGTQKVRVIQEAPPGGVALGAITAGEIARVVFTERMLGEHTGFVWA